MNNLAILTACLFCYAVVLVITTGIAVFSGDNTESDVPWAEWDEHTEE